MEDFKCLNNEINLNVTHIVMRISFVLCIKGPIYKKVDFRVSFATFQILALWDRCWPTIRKHQRLTSWESLQIGPFKSNHNTRSTCSVFQRRKHNGQNEIEKNKKENIHLSNCPDLSSTSILFFCFFLHPTQLEAVSVGLWVWVTGK